MVIIIIIFFLIDEDNLNWKNAKTGGTPYVYKQYTKRAKTRLQKERKNLERKKASQHANHPKNSEKRESLNPKTAKTTLEETEKKGSSSRDLTSHPLGMFFGFTLSKYTKKDK